MILTLPIFDVTGFFVGFFFLPALVANEGFVVGLDMENEGFVVVGLDVGSEGFVVGLLEVAGRLPR